jgi:rhamnulose-1-phosphate aldolase
MKEIIKANRKLRKLILDISEIAGFMWEKGWAERNAGNISVNITSLIDPATSIPENAPFYRLDSNFSELAAHWFLVTGTGKRMRDLARKPLKNALLLRLDEEGRAYNIISSKPGTDSGFKPTSELPTHMSIHRMVKLRGSDETVVAHTHASEFIALTQSREYCDEKILNKLLWGMHPETMVFVPKGVGFVPYRTPGTKQIAQETLKSLENHDVALWEKHGIFAIGRDINETFDVIDILAKSARIFFMCKQSGLEPEGLTDEQLDELRRIVF